MAGAVVAAGLASPPCGAKGRFLTLDEALRAAFGDSLRVETRTARLTEAQVDSVRKKAKATVPSASILHMVGADLDGNPRRYAYLDTHRIRTMPETILIVLDTDGRVRFVEILAFHEPLDYLPPARWLAALKGRLPDGDLRPGRGVPHISGATLTARAIADAVRRASAIHCLLYANRTVDAGTKAGRP